MMILRVEALLDNGQLKFVPVEVMKETDTIEAFCVTSAYSKHLCYDHPV